MSEKEKEEEESFFESICYNCCWYLAKIYTYIQTYLCCWFCKKKSHEVDETTSIINSSNSNITTNNSNSNTYNYNFLVVEIKANNKTYLLEDHSKIMLENKEFLKPKFVYDYLVSKKCIKNHSTNEESIVTPYTINIIDNKTNFVTLDNHSYLLLNRNNYEKIVLNND